MCVCVCGEGGKVETSCGKGMEYGVQRRCGDDIAPEAAIISEPPF